MFGECRFLGMFLFDRFLVFSESSITFPFSLPDVEFVVLIPFNQCNIFIFIMQPSGQFLKCIY